MQDKIINLLQGMQQEEMSAELRTMLIELSLMINEQFDSCKKIVQYEYTCDFVGVAPKIRVMNARGANGWRFIVFNNGYCWFERIKNK